MPRRGGKDWGERDRSSLIADAGRAKGERIRSLLEIRADTDRPLGLVSRPGVGTATVTRYSTTANPAAWAPLSAGGVAVDAVTDAIGDGHDRALLAWPERPDNGFTLAALAMPEAHADLRRRQAGTRDQRRCATDPAALDRHKAKRASMRYRAQQQATAAAVDVHHAHGTPTRPPQIGECCLHRRPARVAVGEHRRDRLTSPLRLRLLGPRRRRTDRARQCIGVHRAAPYHAICTGQAEPPSGWNDAMAANGVRLTVRHLRDFTPAP